MLHFTLDPYLIMPSAKSSSSWCFGRFSESLEKRLRELEIRERMEAIQTTALLKSAWILSESKSPQVFRILLRLQCKPHTVKIIELYISVLFNFILFIDF